MTSLKRWLPIRTHLLACALGLSACTSGIKQADQTCMPNRVRASAFADCLRSNYATLTSGPYDDLGGLYLAEAAREADQVAIGNETARFERAGGERVSSARVSSVAERLRKTLPSNRQKLLPSFEMAQWRNR